MKLARSIMWQQLLANGTLNGSPTFDLNFITGLAIDSRIAFTRASGGGYFDATGTWQVANSNVPRIDYGAMPGGVTNWVRNSVASGSVTGTPGTLPTNWTSDVVLNGMAKQVVGSGVENGIPYVDLRWSGTPSASGGCIFAAFEANNFYASALQQAWTASAYLKVVGGSLANVTFGLNYSERSQSGGFLSGNVSNGPFAITGASLNTQRFSQTFTTSNIDARFVYFFVIMGYTISQPVDVTLRIGLPQVEKALSPQAPIITSGAVTNVGAIPLGLRIEAARSNGVRNPRGEGSTIGAVGSGGVLPTNYITLNSSGLTTTVVASGTEFGIPYTDIRVSGTSSNNIYRLGFDANNGIVAANGQAWSGSAYARLVSGSLTNVTATNMTLWPYNSTPTLLTVVGVTPFSLTTAPLQTQRYSTTATLADATTAFIQAPVIEFVLSGTGVAIDFTVRLGAPQAEIGGTVSSLILPTAGTPAASTRAVENATMPVSSLLNAGAGTFVAEALMPSLSTINAGLMLVDDGTTANELTMFHLGGTTNLKTYAVAATVQQINANIFTTQLAGVAVKTGATYGPSGVISDVNGNTVTTSGTTWPVGLSTLRLGCGNLGPSSMLDGYLTRVRYWGRSMTAIELQVATTLDGPSLDLSFLTSILDSRIVFARASGAMYFDTTGTLQTAASNVPRIDYGPALTVTNLAPWSNPITGHGWNAGGGDTIAYNAAVAPDGSATAAIITSSTTLTQHATGPLSATITAGGTVTHSIYAKPNGYNRLWLLAPNSNYANSFGAVFNVQTGVFVSSNVNGAGVYLGSSIQSVGNGWYRCSITGIIDSVGTSTGLTAYVDNGAGNYYSGDGVSGLQLWGAQIQQASTVGVYVPTTTAPVTVSLNGVTNWIPNSVAFTGLLAGNVVNTLNSATAPDGTTTAVTITENSATTEHTAAFSIINQRNGTPYTFSAYVKMGTRRYAAIELRNATTWTGGNGFVTVDLQTGTILSTTGSATSSSIVSVGAGWYRVSATGTTSFVTSGTSIQVGPYSGTTTIGTNSYAGDGVSTILTWGWQFEIGSARTAYIPTNGVPVTVGATPLGLLVEDPRTNSVRNPRIEGAVAGTPGTAPTNWNPNVPLGLTQTLALGTESGIPFLDVRWFGTTSDANGGYINFETPTSITASNGQTWSGTFYTRLVGGSLTGVTNLNQTFIDFDSTPVQVGFANVNFTPTAAPLATQRISLIHTIAAATTTSIMPRLVTTIPTATAIDFTIRIGAPQLELGVAPTSVILPAIGTPAATTRAADSATMPADVSWFSAYSGTLAFEFVAPKLPGATVNFNVGGLYNSPRNAFLDMFVSATTTIDGTVFRSSGATYINTGNVLTPGVANKLAASYAASGYAKSVNGAAPNTSAADPVPWMQPPTLVLGTLNSGGQINLNSYLTRVRYWKRPLATAELQLAAT